VGKQRRPPAARQRVLGDRKSDSTSERRPTLRSAATAFTHQGDGQSQHGPVISIDVQLVASGA
jgi:hypothetical protein